MSDCIFCRIARGEIPSKKVYEDEHVYAFHDINPVAPVHVLVIPKAHVDSMAHLGEEHEAAMGRLMVGRAKSPASRAVPTASAPSSIPEGSACRRCIISTSTFWAGPIPCRPC